MLFGWGVEEAVRETERLEVCSEREYVSLLEDAWGLGVPASDRILDIFGA